MLVSKNRMNRSQFSALHCLNKNYPNSLLPGEKRNDCASWSQLFNPDSQYRIFNCDAICALLDLQPEGLCDRAFMEERNTSVSILPCLQWTKNLHALLEDPKGLQLFEYYLQQEGHIYTLSFWFACEGLKEEHDPKKLTAIVKVLIRRFFQRPQLALPEKVRKEMTCCVREGHVDKHMLDSVQQQIERLIEETTYPNFLRSDIYLQYVQSCQYVKHVNTDGDLSMSYGQSFAKPTTTIASWNLPNSILSYGSNILPTLHEDGEFTLQRSQHKSQNHEFPNLHRHYSFSANEKTTTAEMISEFNKREVRLTKDMLMVTQQFRALDVRPKREAYAGTYLQPGGSPYHSSVSKSHAQYSSYNPVSRQDSELQSLSSDARTESDNVSLTDASIDGISITKPNARKQYVRQYQVIKKSAMMNRDPTNHENIIPRTQRVSREQTQPMNPETFAIQLIEKLESVKRDQENEEMLERKLTEVDMSNIDCENSTGPSSLLNSCGSIKYQKQSSLMTKHIPQSLSSNLDGNPREKQPEEDSDQAILDQHVSRVWSDLTPSRSPNFSSPRTCSPNKPRRQQQQLQKQQQQYSNTKPSSYRSQRKEKDVFSTFSGDSGNVNDFQDADELHSAYRMNSFGPHLSKTKLLKFSNAELQDKQNLEIQGEGQRYQKYETTRLSATKKSLTELTDSGVSVISDVPPVATKDIRLLNWLKDTDINGSIRKTEINFGTKFSRKKLINLPQQPFVGDPGMPLLPQPHTATQLEEAKRRLQYEQNRSRQRNICCNIESSTKNPCQYEIMLPAQLNQSTLRKRKQETLSDFTTVVFSFCDEKVPYRTKISGYNVTLKQFKDVLPKKGSYRYFFKTQCEDLDVEVIQEEITDDAEILPLWEGKVMAQVKALE